MEKMYLSKPVKKFDIKRDFYLFIYLFVCIL